MNEEQARQILSESTAQQVLSECEDFFCWSGVEDQVALDGSFTAEQLEAILWWAKNKKGVPFP